MHIHPMVWTFVGILSFFGSVPLQAMSASLHKHSIHHSSTQVILDFEHAAENPTVHSILAAAVIDELLADMNDSRRCQQKNLLLHQVMRILMRNLDYVDGELCIPQLKTAFQHKLHHYIPNRLSSVHNKPIAEVIDNFFPRDRDIVPYMVKHRCERDREQFQDIFTECVKYVIEQQRISLHGKDLTRCIESDVARSKPYYMDLSRALGTGGILHFLYTNRRELSPHMKSMIESRSNLH